jgi:hypothetical protein
MTPSGDYSLPSETLTPKKSKRLRFFPWTITFLKCYYFCIKEIKFFIFLGGQKKNQAAHHLTDSLD